MRERLRARADRVNQECHLGELLREYGYAVVPDRQREQQFSCDLHGMDNKPSARYYGHNNTTYCWVCNESRDPIAYVIAKEGLNFREAIEFLEKRLGLGSLPWSDENNRPANASDEIDTISRSSWTYAQEKERLGTLLTRLTEERDLDCKTLLTFWEVYDRVDYGVARQNWGEQKGLAALQRLRERVMECIKAAS